MLNINYSTAKHIIKQNKLINYGNIQSINNATLLAIQASGAENPATQQIAKIS